MGGCAYGVFFGPRKFNVVIPVIFVFVVVLFGVFISSIVLFVSVTFLIHLLLIY